MHCGFLALKSDAMVPCQVFAVATDGTGSAVYFSGYFRHYLFIQGVVLKNNGSTDAFVAKTSESGYILWAKALGGNGNDTASK